MYIAHHESMETYGKSFSPSGVHMEIKPNDFVHQSCAKFQLRNFHQHRFTIQLLNSPTQRTISSIQKTIPSTQSTLPCAPGGPACARDLQFVL